MSKTRLFKFISADGKVRASSIVCTDILNQMRKNQNTSPMSTLALGRTLIGTTLLASQLKEEQAMSVQIHCEGAMRMVFAQSSYECSVRAYIAEPDLPLSLERGNLTLSPHVGEGTLTVSTYIPGNPLPQKSQVLVHSGEITEDLAHYIRLSQQIPCALNTGVVLGSEGVVTSAGGMLIELMPDHDASHVDQVEASVKMMGSLSSVLGPKVNGEDLLKMFFLGVPGKTWSHPWDVQIACSCNVEKILNSFRLLGAEELKDMIDKKEVVDVQCEMCGKKYKIDPPLVQDIYESVKGLH
jgi:molecular chaperone Hsp33